MHLTQRIHAAEQDFGKINVSTFAHTRRADSVPKLEGIWVKDDSPEKGATCWEFSCRA